MICVTICVFIIFRLVVSEDLEIGEALVAKFEKEFLESEDPYREDARQFLPTNAALVKHTTSLFGDRCNLAWNLELKGEINFTSPNYGKPDVTYPSNFSCHLSFTGSEKCIPVISCTNTIDIRSSIGVPCQNEYLLVTDGIGGGQKFCGGMRLLPTRATGAGRDLYVKIQTSPKPMTKPKTGFRCTVKCTVDSDKTVTPLMKDDTNKLRTINQCVCGFQNKEDRIVGGTDAALNEFPWLAALVTKGQRTPFCGGSLINDRWILTAAHCFFNTNYTASDLDILLHSDLLDMLYLENATPDVALGKKGSIQGPGWNRMEKSDQDEYAQRYEVERVVIHPLYTKKYDYDVALVQIKPSVDLTLMNAPTPICLPRVGNYLKNYMGYNVTVAGWGKAHEKAGASTRKLQKLEGIPILNFTDCVEMMPKFQLTNRMLCAGFIEGGRDACTGDSGGPLVYKESRNRYRQIGVVSFGSGCARRKSPGIYSKLTDLSQWVIYHTNTVKPFWCRDTIS